MKLLNKWRVALTIIAGILALAACSDNDEPEMPDEEEEYRYESADFSEDLLGGGLVYFTSFTAEEGFSVPIKTTKPVEFNVYEEAPFTIEKVIDEDGQRVVGHYKGDGQKRAEIFLVRANNTEDPSRFRHFIVVAVNEDYQKDLPKKSPSSNMTRAYGEFIGMGTQCYGMIGNTTRAILMSSCIPVENQNLVTSQVLDRTEMFEKSGESFSSTMSAWSFNLGFNMKGFEIKNNKDWKMSACFDFGISKNVNTSNDFEYYLNVYKVVRGEIAYNMAEFERLASSTEYEKAKEFISYVAPGFMNAIVKVENNDFKANDFFLYWGSDIISQAQLGGLKLYLYGRETNTYEESIALDASLDLKATKPTSPDSTKKGWYDIYVSKNSQYIGGNAGGGYMNSDYYEATKQMKYSVAIGGNPSLGEDPDKWIAGFETMDENVKWQPISYRRNSESVTSNNTEGEEEPVWSLYPITDMGTIVINAIETLLRTKPIGPDDEKMISNARANLEVIKKARPDYIRSYMEDPDKGSRMVLCDVMMVYEKGKQKSGRPEPFVAADPRNAKKKRIYYPMMANKYFDKKKSSEPQRGHAIDTNVSCFLSAIHTGSHYWYYALAHENDCDGIVDIVFTDKPKDYYTARGDAATLGSGLGNKVKTVAVKYYDESVNKANEKITAFGIFDDHKHVKNIIASTGGSELALSATQSESKAWDEFWKGANKHVGKAKDAFYEGGGALPHWIYPIFTTKDLPTAGGSTNKLRDIKHPDKY